MAVAEITDISECLSYLGKDYGTDEAELGLVQQLKKFAERAVRRYVGSNIVQTTYTHILPKAGGFRHGACEILRLPEYPVRSITSLYEDPWAYGGSASEAFDSNDLLTSGSDYYLAVDQSGLSWFGHVVRISANWPTTPGSIKIIYSAGWSADELDGDVTDPVLDASDIKLAVLKTMAEVYHNAMRSQGKAQGGVVTQQLEGYSVTYDKISSDGGITTDVKELLARFRRRVAG